MQPPTFRARCHRRLAHARHIPDPPLRGPRRPTHQQIKSFLRHGSADRLPYERAELPVLAHEIGSQENIFSGLEKARNRYWLLLEAVLRLQVRATAMTHDALSTTMTHDALSTSPWYDGGAGAATWLGSAG
jgi:hypothetical protein